MADEIRVFLADDNLIVREGVRALLALEHDLTVVGAASDYDELLLGVEATDPHVVVTDIRMPPAFEREGIEAARQVRKRRPGTGVVLLSQYQQASYVIPLVEEGAAGFAYLLKDRVAEGNQLARAIREVATGGSMIDPAIVEAMLAPMKDEGGLTAGEDELLRLVAEGRSIKAIAVARATTPARIADEIEAAFLKVAEGASAGVAGSIERLRRLHRAIVAREELGETLARFLPSGVAEQLREQGRQVGESERLIVTVLMSDVRGYSAIAESTDPTILATQLHEHRAEMGRAIAAESGTVMQFVGDAVMAVFGAPLPQPDHAERAVRAAVAMQERQTALNERWAAPGLAPFPLGIGLSTGEVAAALLGSEEHIEYTVVGDVVNLAQRLQSLARAGEVVLTEAAHAALGEPLEVEPPESTPVKGRSAPVSVYRLRPGGPSVRAAAEEAALP